MSTTRFHSSWRPFVVAFVVAASIAAQSPPTPGTVPITPPVDTSPTAPPTANFFDNTKGNLVRWQLGHVRPMAVDPVIGHYLFAPNNAGQRMTITYLPGNMLVGEIPTGPGITAITHRPNTVELWAVDSIHGCITVINPLLNQVVRTIPVGKEPHGIAMLSTGARAYVSCSGTNTVDVIDCASFSVLTSIAVPATGLRGITVVNDTTVWVVPLFSGNGTVTKRTVAASGDASAQAVVLPNPLLGEAPMLDQDLFAITVATNTLDAAQTTKNLGTILFDVCARPGTTELWVPNTEANNLVVGEPNFVGGAVVTNRIAVVDSAVLPATSPSRVQHHDLDVQVAPLGIGAAQPAAIAFDSPRNRAYVAAFGSDVVLVLDANSKTVIGHHLLTPVTPPMPAGGSTPTPTPARCGPRGLVLGPNGGELFVFNGIDNSFSRIDLSVLVSTAPIAVPFGFDPTPHAVKRGLGHLANADHSLSKASSCMSCHVDGHFDMLSWNLGAFSDPPGTPAPAFEQDAKGPMATQSLRGLFEAGPLHWRGERVNLAAFNHAFVGLLKRPSPLTKEEFAELETGAFSLVYPANPRQPADRVYTGPALLGQTAFRSTFAVGGSTCASCHTLPLGSSAEVQFLVTTRFPAGSAKVPHLRGVGDKLGGVHPVFPVAPVLRPNRTTNGWGLTHGATIATIAEFVQAFPGIVGTNLVNEVAAFVDAFDTGLAPATAFQRTLVPGVHTATEFVNTLNFIKAQALAGDCDIVVASAANSGGIMVPFTMAFDHVLQLWQTGTGVAAFTDAQLQQFTFTAGLTVTFYGQPLGTGRRFGVDRDQDDLLDNDELLFTPFLWSHLTNPDTDNDGFPDGHEAQQPGMNPRVANGTSPDNSAPKFTSAITQVFVTSSTLKFEFSTDEPSRAEIVAPPGAASRSPTAGGLDRNHAIFVRELPPNTQVAFTIRVTDANGNQNSQVVTATTLAIADAARVVSITNQGFTSPTLTVQVTIGAFLTPATTNTDGSLIEAFAYCEAPGTGLVPIVIIGTPPATPNKTVSFPLTIPAAVLNGPIGQRKLHFGVRNITPTLVPPSTFAYIEALDIENYKVFTF